jgi:tetratricopeptide (TPR) repeat protein
MMPRSPISWIITLIICCAALVATADEGEAMAEEKEFPESEWPQLQELMEDGGAEAVVGYISAIEDPQRRRKLFVFAHQGFAYRDWEGKNLDALVTVVEAGIAEYLAQAGEAAADDERDKLLDGANIEAYNLAADLAPCWPGDELPRSNRHFEKGVELAERCLDWRHELEKGPAPFSMAWWALGTHQLFLGDYEEAADAFTKALDYAVLDAQAREEPIECAAGSDFSVLLNMGYLGLARWAAGDADGETLYRDALEAFNGTVVGHPDKSDDAEFGIAQLELVQSRVID